MILAWMLALLADVTAASSVIAFERPVGRVVMFTADWCGPCQEFKEQVIPELIKAGWVVDTNDACDLKLITVDKGPIPRFSIYIPDQNGDAVEIARHVGGMTKTEFLKWVNKNFQQPDVPPPAPPAREPEVKSIPQWNYHTESLLR